MKRFRIPTILSDILFLAAVGALAYWPLTFHVFSLKNDALNYFLPVRFQISEAIHYHHYPFWSPYFNLGYALQGDMQSGVWNPIVLILSLFGPYTLYTLQVETLLYIFLSGAGMYFLLKEFKYNRTIRLAVAIAYMLCGYNSDSSQFLNWIASAAFLPFVLLWYYRTLTQKGITAAVFTGLFLYLQFVSAYPAHFIITLYLLLASFIYHSFIGSRHRPTLFLKTIATGIARLLPTILCFILLALPAILSYSQYLPLSERGSGTTYEEVMSDSMHPFFLISYLTPIAVFNAPWHDITDPLVRNSYFGLLIFLFAAASFFIRTNDPRIRFARVAVIMFQLLSLGSFGGLRSLAYYLLPLMNTFRHPACLRIFTIFFACFLAAWSIGQLAAGYKNNIYKIITYACFIVLAGLFIFSIPAVSPFIHLIKEDAAGLRQHTFPPRAWSLKHVISQFSPRQFMLADILLQIPFLVILLFYILPKRNMRAILWLTTINSLLHIFLLTKDTAADIQHVLDKTIVHGYPLPGLEKSLQENSVDDSAHFSEIGCANMYNKLVGRNGYRITPSNLLSQNAFWNNEPLRKTVMQYALCYRPDTILFSPDNFPAPAPGHSIAVLNDSLKAAAINRYQPHGDCRLSILTFQPDYFCLESNAGEKEFAVLLQNDYPLWRLTIDGHRQPILRTNLSFMGMEIPAGHHRIEFTYADQHLVITFWLSAILFLLLLIALAFYRPAPPLPH